MRNDAGQSIPPHGLIGWDLTQAVLTSELTVSSVPLVFGLSPVALLRVPGGSAFSGGAAVRLMSPTNAGLAMGTDFQIDSVSRHAGAFTPFETSQFCIRTSRITIAEPRGIARRAEDPAIASVPMVFPVSGTLLQTTSGLPVTSVSLHAFAPTGPLIGSATVGTAGVGRVSPYSGTADLTGVVPESGPVRIYAVAGVLGADVVLVDVAIIAGDVAPAGSKQT